MSPFTFSIDVWLTVHYKQYDTEWHKYNSVVLLLALELIHCFHVYPAWPFSINIQRDKRVWHSAYRNWHQSNGSLCSCPVPQACYPVHYAYKQTTVLYNEVDYFGRLINRGSVCVLALCFIREKSWRRTRDNGRLDWKTYHFGSHVWKNAGTWPSQNQCGLALVGCELFSNKLRCNADLLQRPKVHQGPPWDLLVIPGEKDWMCQLLSVLCMKHQKQKGIDQHNLFLLLLCGWSLQCPNTSRRPCGSHLARAVCRQRCTPMAVLTAAGCCAWGTAGAGRGWTGGCCEELGASSQASGLPLCQLTGWGSPGWSDSWLGWELGGLVAGAAPFTLCCIPGAVPECCCHWGVLVAGWPRCGLTVRHLSCLLSSLVSCFCSVCQSTL